MVAMDFKSFCRCKIHAFIFLCARFIATPPITEIAVHYYGGAIRGNPWNVEGLHLCERAKNLLTAGHLRLYNTNRISRNLEHCARI